MFSSFDPFLIVAYIVPFLAVLTVIVFVHEYGHFKVARLCGVHVEVFSVGFGRPLFARKDKYGTEWRIGWVPLGGYVKFAGDENVASMPASQKPDESTHPGDFHTKPVSKRAAIVAAGPIANFILAIFIFAAVYMTIGLQTSSTVVNEVLPDTPAEQAGFLPGDEIVRIDGKKIRSFSDIQRIVSGSANQELSIDIVRQGAERTINATPVHRTIDDNLGGKIRVGQLGISATQAGTLTYERQGPLEAVGLAVDQTWFIISSSLKYFGKVISGKENFDQVAGPVGLAKVTKTVAGFGLLPLIQLAAVLSISIGLINLFPIPVLDGGHLMYYLIEAIRGKPLGRNAQETGFKVGLALVLTLMVVATWNDILRIFAS